MSTARPAWQPLRGTISSEFRRLAVGASLELAVYAEADLGLAHMLSMKRSDGVSSSELIVS
jgi:hypothetical protein